MQYSIGVEMHWTPAHSTIQENEFADSLAKEADLETKRLHEYRIL